MDARSSSCATTSSSAATAGSAARRPGVPRVRTSRSSSSTSATRRSRRPRERDVLYIEGDGTEDEDLASAGIDRARGLVASADSDADNLYITLSARQRRPDLTIVARASDEDAEKKLKLAGADRVVSRTRRPGA